ncbi:MAG: cell wall-binding repeat-containing protein [Firmicutes bacterium]|nr:cell wall-binding repeat-containing protein [Bacillota bacterium]
MKPHRKGHLIGAVTVFAVGAATFGLPAVHAAEPSAPLTTTSLAAQVEVNGYPNYATADVLHVGALEKILLGLDAGYSSAGVDSNGTGLGNGSALRVKLLTGDLTAPVEATSQLPPGGTKQKGLPNFSLLGISLGLLNASADADKLQDGTPQANASSTVASINLLSLLSIGRIGSDTLAQPGYTQAGLQLGGVSLLDGAVKILDWEPKITVTHDPSGQVHVTDNTGAAILQIGGSEHTLLPGNSINVPLVGEISLGKTTPITDSSGQVIGASYSGLNVKLLPILFGGVSLQLGQLEAVATQPQMPPQSSLRLGGQNRMQTAAYISKKLYPNGANNVVIVDGSAWHLIDALPAGPLASALNAPILLATEYSKGQVTLDSNTLAELTRLQPQSIVLLGAANSDAVKAALPGSARVISLQGKNREATAALIAEELAAVTGKTSFSSAFIAPEEDSHMVDAIVASPFAAQQVAPILLASGKGTLSDDEARYLGSGQKEYVIGAAANYGLTLPGQVTPITGQNRYATAVAVNTKFAPQEGYPEVVLADGVDAHMIDALTAAPYAAAHHAATVLSNDTDTLPAESAAFLQSQYLSHANLMVAGGPAAVTDNALKEAFSLLQQ